MSVGGGGVTEGAGVADEETLAVGDATVVGKRPGCVSSWAGENGTAQFKKSKAQQ
jgi:hypothetical protein